MNGARQAAGPGAGPASKKKQQPQKHATSVITGTFFP